MALWKQWFIWNVYARHRRFPSLDSRRALRLVLSRLDHGHARGLNVGSSLARLHAGLINLDIRRLYEVNVVGTALRLPFLDGVFACVLSINVLEHLPDPDLALREAVRVLRPGGLVYLQAPFIIGFHSGPHDYWRFTQVGLQRLVLRQQLNVVETGIATGAGTGMYHVAVEYVAAVCGALWSRLYLPTKAAGAVLLSPLRWADHITKAGDANRIAGSFFIIAEKRDDSEIPESARP